MALAGYNVDPDLNTTISGLDIAEDCSPANVNDVIRQIMADLAQYNIDVVGDIAEVQADADRAIVVPVGELGSEVPAVGLRANKVVLFDALGNAGVASFATVYNGTQAVVADHRTVMTAMAGVTVGQSVALSEPYREGMFDVRVYTDYSALVTADTAQGVVVRSVADPTKVFVRQYDGTLRPRYFGAVGDGTTNDTNAFLGMSAVLNYLSGGGIELEPKTYLLGIQTLAGATGLGYSLHGQLGFIAVQNCTKPVVINGNGAKLKLINGYKYGSFSPTTGIAAAVSTDPDKQASIVSGLIYLKDNTGQVSIHDIELDGNVANLTLGGPWGDTGYQVPGSGVWAMGSDTINMRNVYSHHNPTDGMILGYTGLTVTSETKPTVMESCKFLYNGRQGLSWVGGNSLSAASCDFSHTGKNGVVSSAPGAGLDIEAETSIIRNGKFASCRFIDNGYGMVAASGDSAECTFQSCTFIGTTSYALSPTKPRFRFYDCEIVGTLLSPYCGSIDNAGDAARFTRCRFTNDSSLAPGGILYTGGGGYLLDFGGVDCWARFNDCQFVHDQPTTTYNGFGSNVTYTNCEFIARDGGFQITGTFQGNTRFIEDGGDVVGTPAAKVGGTSDAGPALDSWIFRTGGVTTSYGATEGALGNFPVAGALLLSGNNADPTPGALISFVGRSDVHGLQFGGYGTTNDYRVVNSAGATIMSVPHATVNPVFPGAPTGAGWKVNNIQVVGAQQAAIATPAGGATVDTEARTALASVLAALRAHGAIAT